MDVTCPKCGTTNRNTSRFCAKCGEELPRSQDSTQQDEGTLNLPWLQAVHEKAVKQTGGLNPNVVAEAEARIAAQELAKEREAAQPQPQPSASAVPSSPQAQTKPNSTNAPDEPPPDWVVGILEPGAKPQIGAEQTYESEELGHIMPWMSGQPQTGSSEDPQKGGKPGLPPWLGDVTVQETLQPSGQAPAEIERPITEAAELGIEELQPFVPPEAPEQAVVEPVDTERPTPKKKKNVTAPVQVPQWLKPLAPKIGEEDAPPPPPPPPTQPNTRFGLEPTGALIAPIERDIPVRPPRPGSVETLATLLTAPTGETFQRAVPDMERAHPQGVERQTGLRQWLLPDGLIYVVILAALVAVLLIRPPFGEQNAPGGRDVMEFYNAVEQSPAAMPVLLVYDWDATRSAEMSALSNAVTRHLMMRQRLFLTISTVPQGAGFAQQITDAARGDYGYEYGRDYLLFGYLPGNEAALSSLVNNFDAAMPFDYVNGHKLSTYTIARQGQLSQMTDFGLIINLASDEGSVRNWIEQVSVRTGVPIVAAVPQALEPLTRPYKKLPGAGLSAVLSGNSGALSYTQQLTQNNQGSASKFNTAELTDRLNAQSVAQILVALVILAAFVNLGTQRIFRR